MRGGGECAGRRRGCYRQHRVIRKGARRRRRCCLRCLRRCCLRCLHRLHRRSTRRADGLLGTSRRSRRLRCARNGSFHRQRPFRASGIPVFEARCAPVVPLKSIFGFAVCTCTFVTVLTAPRRPDRPGGFGVAFGFDVPPPITGFIVSVPSSSARASRPASSSRPSWMAARASSSARASRPASSSAREREDAAAWADRVVPAASRWGPSAAPCWGRWAVPVASAAAVAAS